VLRHYTIVVVFKHLPTIQVIHLLFITLPILFLFVYFGDHKRLLLHV